MNRKEFLKNCSLACLSSSMFTILLQSCSSANYYAKTELVNNTTKISKSEFVINTNEKETTYRKYVLVKLDRSRYPICIYRISDIKYFALLMECTHKGCELQPNDNYLICPCHGSEFSSEGIVQNPPAEQNLKTFKLTYENENIFIHH